MVFGVRFPISAGSIKGGSRRRKNELWVLKPCCLALLTCALNKIVRGLVGVPMAPILIKGRDDRGSDPASSYQVRLPCVPYKLQGGSPKAR